MTSCGRDAAVGRRASIVLVAEGARDSRGDPVTADHVRAVLEQRLGEDARVTILGHVQRGGAPSAFDRYLGTVLGYAAVRQLLDSAGRRTAAHRHPRAPRALVAAGRVRGQVTIDRRRDRRRGTATTAMQMRGGSFRDSHRLLQTITQARPRRPGAISGRCVSLCSTPADPPPG